MQYGKLLVFIVNAALRIVHKSMKTLYSCKKTNLGKLLLAFENQREYMRLKRLGRVRNTKVVLCWF